MAKRTKKKATKKKATKPTARAEDALRSRLSALSSLGMALDYLQRATKHASSARASKACKAAIKRATAATKSAVKACD